MENKEKKINAVELNDENLENVSGGVVPIVGNDSPRECTVCGAWSSPYYLHNGQCYCEACWGNNGF